MKQLKLAQEVAVREFGTDRQFFLSNWCPGQLIDAMVSNNTYLLIARHSNSHHSITYLLAEYTDIESILTNIVTLFITVSQDSCELSTPYKC